MTTGSTLDGISYLLQQLVNGVTLGSIYGLIALGYTMVFGIIGMVNFAHGDVFMLATFIALILYLLLTQIFGLPSIVLSLLIVMLLAMVMTAAWSVVIERVAYRPLRGSFRLAPLISAIGMSIFLLNLVQVLQGPNNKSLPPLLDGGILVPLGAGYSFTIAWKQVLIVLVTTSLLAVFWFVVQRTALGRAQRACEQDRKMAALVGIDVDRTIAITFAIGGALAAVAGCLYLVLYGVVNHHDGFVPGIKAFAAAVLGGIGSLPGAVLGGLIIGLVETLWAAYVSSDYKDVVAFAVLALTLVVKPTGLLGKPEVEKV
jgi:branched-chain amino acid transport system permease protein